MDKELLMLYGATHAVLRMIDKGYCDFAKRLDNGTWQTVEYEDIYNYLTDMIEQDSIIDKIRTEIENQEKWLMGVGYNAYNVDIAFNSIKSVLKEGR